MSRPRSRIERVKPSAHGPLDGPQLTAVAELFATLSESSRLQILQVLQNAPASVTEVVEQTGFKQANASKQLNILHRAGVVSRQQEGNHVVYSIAMPLIFDLCQLMCNGIAKQAIDYAEKLTR